MKMAAAALLFVLVVLVIGGAAGDHMDNGVSTTAGVTCNAVQLSPCANAIKSATTTPTATCCSKLKEQRPCLCIYMKNPFLQRFINSPNARKVATACGTPFPTCT